MWKIELIHTEYNTGEGDGCPHESPLGKGGFKIFRGGRVLGPGNPLKRVGPQLSGITKIVLLLCVGG